MTLPPDIEDRSDPDGPTLRDLLDAGPFPIGLALEIARQVLDDLAEESSLRGALSSDRLRLVRDSAGAPVIRRIDLQTGDEEAEASSDIHAFGVLLYELLTGAHPFRDRTSSVPLSFQVSDRQRRLPPELRTIVLTAIAEDPEGRFQSARALATELAKIQALYPLGERAYEAAMAARSPRPNRGTRLPLPGNGGSSRGLLLRLSALCAVLALLLAFWALQYRQVVPENATATVDHAVDPPRFARAEESEPEALPAVDHSAPQPAEIPSDNPGIRTEPVPAPARQARAAVPRPSPPQRQPSARRKPAVRPTRSSGPSRLPLGEEGLESESAVPLSAPAPRYPEAARGTGTWAEVVVGLTIDEAGAVRNATIEKSHIRGSAPASAFHEAALTAARQVRYHPAREKGVPVRSWSTLTFTFEAPGS